MSLINVKPITTLPKKLINIGKHCKLIKEQLHFSKIFTPFVLILSYNMFFLLIFIVFQNFAG